MTEISITEQPISSKKLLLSLADGCSLKIKFRSENTEAWNQILNGSNYAPFVYTNEFIDYQILYEKFHGRSIRH